MKPVIPSLILLTSVFLTGCLTRSISNTQPGGYYGSGNTLYQGELSELDLLGSAPLAQSKSHRSSPRISKGDKVLAIQSGALFPDGEMLTELQKHFEVAPFSGIPASEKGSSYSQQLREAASRGGYTKIFCYWGLLETTQEKTPGAAVSWIPIVGWVVPDKSMDTRIRMKAMIMEVSTGNWTMIAPEGFKESELTTFLTRGDQDDQMILRLKEVCYKKLVEKLL